MFGSLMRKMFGVTPNIYFDIPEDIHTFSVLVAERKYERALNHLISLERQNKNFKTLSFVEDLNRYSLFQKDIRNVISYSTQLDQNDKDVKLAVRNLKLILLQLER